MPEQPFVVHCPHDLVPITECRRHPRNRNTHPAKQIELLAKILKYQGWRWPVIISRLSGCVVAGHGRIDAATANGWEMVPVSYQNFESEDQEIAFLIADNQIAWKLFPGDVIYTWHSSIPSWVHANALQEAGFTIRTQIIWAKGRMVISRSDYHHRHEPCWYAVRTGKKANFTDDRTQTTVWDIDKPQKSETGHSTQKPIECMARPMRNHDSKEV